MTVGGYDVNNLILVGLLVILVLLTGLFYVNQILRVPPDDLGGGDVTIHIKKGSTLSDVADLLEKNKLTNDASKFKLAARLMNVEKSIQPGRFLLPRGVGNATLLRYLSQPGISTIDVTIPEGLTYKQIASIFQREMEIDSMEFVSLCQDFSFIAQLGLSVGNLEGYLFPDTYNLYQRSNARDVIRRMVEHFMNIVQDGGVNEGARRINMSLHEVVTLASIIEGEVVKVEEATTVSAVYHNRLKKRMQLGADPTIQYIIPDGPRRLLNKDLQIESPYNTYKYRGLPPGPINNPGRDALLAAVNPADVDFLYFVATGDGGHAFNKTAAGHDIDKAKFQKVRREVSRQKQNARR